MKTPNCISCEEEMPNLDERGNQPGNGLEFVTLGHYGSTKFDPMDGTRLAINVCDRCLEDARSKENVLFVRDGQYETWK